MHFAACRQLNFYRYRWVMDYVQVCNKFFSKTNEIISHRFYFGWEKSRIVELFQQFQVYLCITYPYLNTNRMNCKCARKIIHCRALFLSVKRTTSINQPPEMAGMRVKILRVYILNWSIDSVIARWLCIWPSDIPQCSLALYT